MVVRERRGLIRASTLTEVVRQRLYKQCHSAVVVKAANTAAHLQFCASRELTEEAEAEDGGTEPRRPNPLMQGVTCVETDSRIPSSERQRLSISAPQMTQAPSFSLRTQDTASPGRHLLKQMWR